jgi:hypothetical protein
MLPHFAGAGLAMLLVFSGGCATSPSQSGPAPAERAHAHAASTVKGVKPPFFYEPLSVRNSCFVESVHFYDEYLARRRGGENTWARVLQWGNSDGDMKVQNGHAVTVFVAKNQLWFYDINFGALPIELPLDRRADITDVAPKIFDKYPQYRPIFARYRDDFPQKPPAKRPEHLFYHANPDVRDATRVAHAFSRVRPAAVFEFDLKENGQTVTAAGVAFLFGARVCLYFPRGGTHVSPALRGSYDDLRYIHGVTRRMFPTAENVRWQGGGYILFPPKK